MKNTLTFVLIFFMGTIVFYGQSLFKTKNAIVKFDAAKSNLEPIKAENDKVKLILNTENGEIACLMNVIDFSFSNKLMQEHFNENYIESHKYPKAKFLGRIKDFKLSDFETKSEIKIKGKFTIHGVTQEKNILLFITKTRSKYLFEGKFKIELENYQIKIPKIMFYKITENVNVSIQAELDR